MWGGALAVTMLPFLALVKYHNRLFHRKDYLEKEAEINRQELAALALDTSTFNDGAEYIHPGHLYAFDLDIYGPHSLFQCLNRTSTQPGRTRLAAWLGQHLEDKAEIEDRQAAVRELSALTDFRQRFRILGLLHKGKSADESELQAWAASPTTFRNRILLRLLPYVVGGANALSLLLVLTGVMPASGWGTLWIAFMLLSFLFTGKITKVQNVYGKKLQILGTYARLLRLMDGQPLEAPLLRDIKEESSRASHAILRLNKLMNELDQRNNYLMYTVLNGTFFWEIWQIMRIERWKEHHAASLPAWLNAIGRMDALLSLATFAHNHPDYAYPTLIDPADEVFRFRATALGHPLMPADRCVRNDFGMTRRPEFIIITGANMAGKSTYLRTVGINYLLACIGAPVCATEMELTPVRLITSQAERFAGPHPPVHDLAGQRHHRHARPGPRHPGRCLPRPNTQPLLRGRHHGRHADLQLSPAGGRGAEHECLLPDGEDGDCNGGIIRNKAVVRHREWKSIRELWLTAA